MNSKKTFPVFAGLHKLKQSTDEVTGFLTELEGEEMYCIGHFDQMPPFFMTLTSSCDLWMYLSSSGGVTAGRQNYNRALFPYETDDKIHLSFGHTGPKTLFRIKKNDKYIFWEPFSENQKGIYSIERNLYKNISGSKIIFEELNKDLRILFQYTWEGSDQLGWVRQSNLKNFADEPLQIEFLDGIQNIIPPGIELILQNTMSTLMDAYKIAEYIPEQQIALFRMSSVPTDRAEPSEALKTHTVWSIGFDNNTILLSNKQLSDFKKGLKIKTEDAVRGERTSFFVCNTIDIEPDNSKKWYIVADVDKDHTEVIELMDWKKKIEKRPGILKKSLHENHDKLQKLVAMADGIQFTGDRMEDRRHFSNVMFNVMRGGIFENNYVISMDHFRKHIAKSNQDVLNRNKRALQAVSDNINLHDLYDLILSLHDDDLWRLTLEYLPLSFSRRHGDPSRPWNFFDIKIFNPDKSPSLSYQGNWRDIFQNWETLSFSFSAFLPGMVSKFLNASTIDGYNPYRITNEGFDWEVPEPENPLAYIGYWGDHQVVYLFRLMQMLEKFYPGKTLQIFQGNIFTFADVPYRILSYDQILRNPADTIAFEWERHHQILQRKQKTGIDGLLKHTREGHIQKASLMDKLMVTLLTKLSNFIPDAGIWLNTQRPEWNDANNALAGKGASIVTICYIRQWIRLLEKILTSSAVEHFESATEIQQFFKDIYADFAHFKNHLNGAFSPETRKNMTDALGKSGEIYREKAYKGFSGKKSEITKKEILSFFALIINFLDKTIQNNRRDDGLFHAYNMLEFSEQQIKILRLNLMLEGQVAILNSELLNANQTNDLIGKLFESNLYRPDQESFMLYPLRRLPGFMEKNTLTNDKAKQSDFLQQLPEKTRQTIMKQDREGNWHFAADLKNGSVLKEKITPLAYAQFDKKQADIEIQKVLQMYEEVFAHRYFTGRSGSFYKYEGLGSIYWHMVSKLLLAVGENILRFSKNNANPDSITQLQNYYHRIKKGIGVHKSPENYGGFTTDPYSHTPAMTGAQQPGLTGQVKEDVLSRFIELGISVFNGQIEINPVLLRKTDFDDQNKLEFSVCQTPFVYFKNGDFKLKIQTRDALYELNTLVIPENISSDIFARNGKVKSVEVHL